MKLRLGYNIRRLGYSDFMKLRLGYNIRLYETSFRL